MLLYIILHKIFVFYDLSIVTILKYDFLKMKLGRKGGGDVYILNGIKLLNKYKNILPILHTKY